MSKAIVLAVLVLAVPATAAQRFPELTGTWRGVCADCAPNAMPGGFARTLIIRASASGIAVQRDGFPVDVYRLDGTETSLTDGRTATARVEDGSLVVTTVRRRAHSRDEVYQTVMRHVHLVSGNTLTIEHSTRAIRPSEPPSDRWIPLGKAMYRRD